MEELSNCFRGMSYLDFEQAYTQEPISSRTTPETGEIATLSGENLQTGRRGNLPTGASLSVGALTAARKQIRLVIEKRLANAEVVKRP